MPPDFKDKAISNYVHPWSPLLFKIKGRYQHDALSIRLFIEKKTRQKAENKQTFDLTAEKMKD